MTVRSVAAGLAVACVLSTTPAAQASDVAALVAPYVRARERGDVGEVTGSARAEPRNRQGEAVPYASVAVILLPASPRFEGELDAVKLSQRDSQRTYLEAVARVEATRASYERTLLSIGAADLIRRDVTTSAGDFQFPTVPAGHWVLLAWRRVEHATSGRKIQRREADRFVGNVERTGHEVATYWRFRIEVTPGGAVQVALTDRNVWLTGVREEVRPPEPAGDAARRGRGTAR